MMVETQRQIQGSVSASSRGHHGLEGAAGGVPKASTGPSRMLLSLIHLVSVCSCWWRLTQDSHLPVLNPICKLHSFLVCFLGRKLTWISSCCTTCIWTRHWAVLRSSRACSLFRCLQVQRNTTQRMKTKLHQLSSFTRRDKQRLSPRRVLRKLKK